MVQLIIQTVTVDEKENTRGAVLSIIDISKYSQKMVRAADFSAAHILPPDFFM